MLSQGMLIHGLQVVDTMMIKGFKQETVFRHATAVQACAKRAGGGGGGGAPAGRGAASRGPHGPAQLPPGGAAAPRSSG